MLRLARLPDIHPAPSACLTVPHPPIPLPPLGSCRLSGPNAQPSFPNQPTKPSKGIGKHRQALTGSSCLGADPPDPPHGGGQAATRARAVDLCGELQGRISYRPRTGSAPVWGAFRGVMSHLPAGLGGGYRASAGPRAPTPASLRTLQGLRWQRRRRPTPALTPPADWAAVLGPSGDSKTHTRAWPAGPALQTPHSPRSPLPRPQSREDWDPQQLEITSQ